MLAIWVKRSFLEQCLSKAVCSNIFGPPAPPTSAAAAAARGGGRPKPARCVNDDNTAAFILGSDRARREQFPPP